MTYEELRRAFQIAYDVIFMGEDLPCSHKSAWVLRHTDLEWKYQQSRGGN